MSTANLYFDSALEAIKWLPRSGEPRDFADVPEHIASAASESYECLSIGANRAAVAMSRAVIEATAKDKGHTSGVLAKKIDDMAAADLLRPGTAEMAHEVRHWGNDMAHGDFAKPIGGEEADGVLILMTEILQEVYQAPARLDRIRALRVAANAEPNS